MKDYYKILQVSKNATIEEIKKAYRKLAKKFHPDANNNDPKAEERFKEIGEAYKVLGDETKKAEYDRKMFGSSEDIKENNQQKKRRNHHSNMSSYDFSKTSDIFEEFFGFNPNNTSPNLNRQNKKVKPMKTKDVFEAIFGKNRF
ncbi:DnaJ domain-containing protein [Defluviitalea phaphyphila]|uniref:DnaJ domain-containing protein n=1 Tax=Defluviitalea phaphyphila TaxID=1473580 RepID=UPI00072FCDD9|nr:DnaJ domain-containing protein [Defluviitalea phaphyphila]